MLRHFSYVVGSYVTFGFFFFFLLVSFSLVASLYGVLPVEGKVRSFLV